MAEYKVGYCPGSFDMFHMGHLNLLRRSKEKCDYLIAGVVTDEVYMSYKLRPPIIPFEERLEIVSQCKYVDRAIGVTMELQDKWKAWEELQYDCHFAGSDHEGAWSELGRRLNEVGATLVFFPYTQNVSSTTIRQNLERDFVFREAMGEYQNPKLVLFGSGAIADSYLESYGLEHTPAFFVDNNKKKWGTIKYGISIESPEKLNAKDKNQFVIICSKYASEIAKQLVSMGIRDYRIWSESMSIGLERHSDWKQLLEQKSLRCTNGEVNIQDLSAIHSQEQTGYVVPEKQRAVWQVQLQILEEVDRICKKYGFTYFAMNGTLLGAVRHKGFIPWDDDLDIGMLREDYDAFMKATETELPKYLFVQNINTDPNVYYNGITRIRDSRTTGITERDLKRDSNQGIWIDIIPLDKSPKEDDTYRKKSQKVSYWNRMVYAKVYGNEKNGHTYGLSRIRWNWYRLKARFQSLFYIEDRLTKAMKEVYAGEQELGIYTGIGKHRQLNEADFADTKELPFEDRMIPVPKGYENYLFMVMGSDYMKYPPENERKMKHRGIFDSDKPYTDYVKVFCGMFDNVKGRQIILFGAGMMFDDYMLKFGKKYRPEFLVDNDKNKWGRRRQGIDIKSPNEILTISQKKRKVIICSAYYPEIEKQLQEMGIMEYSIYIQHLDWIIDTEKNR